MQELPIVACNCTSQTQTCTCCFSSLAQSKLSACVCVDESALQAIKLSLPKHSERFRLTVWLTLYHQKANGHASAEATHVHGPRGFVTGLHISLLGNRYRRAFKCLTRGVSISLCTWFRHDMDASWVHVCSVAGQIS